MIKNNPIYAKYSRSPQAYSPAAGVKSTAGFVAVLNLTQPFERNNVAPSERFGSFIVTDAKVILENGKRGLYVVKGDPSAGIMGMHIW
jgi:hypothetical protein